MARARLFVPAGVLALCSLDIVAVSDLALRETTCHSDCIAGFALAAFAPVTEPIAATGVFDEGSTVSTGSVFGALVIVLVLALAWWSVVGGLAAEIARRRASRRAFIGVLVAAVPVTVLPRLVATSGDAGLDVLLELAATAALAGGAFALTRRPPDRAPVGPGAPLP